ncbi:unnamed protein product [Lota lota]
MGTSRGKGCGFKTRISGLQLAVYWRLCLIFFFNSFLFFLDIYTVCSGRHAHNRTDNRTEPEDVVLNGSFGRNEKSDVRSVTGDQLNATRSALLGFSFSLGMVVQAPLAYAFSSWTALHLALGLPQILCLPIIM